MVYAYLLDYFLFTFFASFGVLQIALSKKTSTRHAVGTLIVILSYLWFFGSKDRSVPTIVEGVQLLVVFAVSALLAIVVAKISTPSLRKK